MKKTGKVGLVLKDVTYLFNLGGDKELILPYKIELFSNTIDNIYFVINMN